MAKIIGIKKIITKAGKEGYEYHCADKFDSYTLEHAECSGNQVFTEYSPIQFNVKVGDDVILVYQKGFQGRAQLMEMHSIENKLKMNKQV